MTENETRRRLATVVDDRPGIHFNALVRDLDLAPGQVQYHLRRLIRTGSIVEEQRYGRTHYYPPRYDEWERGALALARRETARDVVLYLVRHGESEPGVVADEIGVARSTLEWHLTRLVEYDIVRKRRDDRNRVSLVLARPTETLRVLDAVEPSLPERFVDRFMRLVDGLLVE